MAALPPPPSAWRPLGNAAGQLLDPTDGPPPAPVWVPRKAGLTYVQPARWATVNKAIRQHWAVRSAETSELREWAWGEARRSGAVLPRLQVVDVLVRHEYGPGPLPDTDAPSLAVKALLDGLVDARVIPDDSGAHVRSITYLAATRSAQGHNALTLLLTEVRA